MRKTGLHSRRVAGGFTLIELMVVIAIIAILAAAVMPKIVGKTETAKRARAKSDIVTFKTALTAFYLDCGRYPTTSEGLDALIKPPGGIDPDKYQEGGYLDVAKVPNDPWDKKYIYVCPSTRSGSSYDLESYGRDGRDGGSRDNADIESWNLADTK